MNFTERKISLQSSTKTFPKEEEELFSKNLIVNYSWQPMIWKWHWNLPLSLTYPTNGRIMCFTWEYNVGFYRLLSPLLVKYYKNTTRIPWKNSWTFRKNFKRKEVAGIRTRTSWFQFPKSGALPLSYQGIRYEGLSFDSIYLK